MELYVVIGMYTETGIWGKAYDKVDILGVYYSHKAAEQMVKVYSGEGSRYDSVYFEKHTPE